MGEWVGRSILIARVAIIVGAILACARQQSLEELARPFASVEKVARVPLVPAKPTNR